MKKHLKEENYNYYGLRLFFILTIVFFISLVFSNLLIEKAYQAKFFTNISLVKTIIPGIFLGVAFFLSNQYIFHDKLRKERNYTTHVIIVFVLMFFYHYIFYDLMKFIFLNENIFYFTDATFLAFILNIREWAFTKPDIKVLLRTWWFWTVIAIIIVFLYLSFQDIWNCHYGWTNEHCHNFWFGKHLH